MRGIEAVTRLSWAYMANTQQGISGSWIRSKSAVQTMAGVIDSLKPGGDKLAKQVGVIANEAMTQYLADAYGSLSSFGKIGRAALRPLTETEIFNRVVSSNVGKRYITETLVPSFLKNPNDLRLVKELKTFLISPQELRSAGQLTAPQLNDAIHMFVRQTQFAADPLT